MYVAYLIDMVAFWSSNFFDIIWTSCIQCRRRLVDKIFEECSKDINENEMIYNVTLNDHGKVCKSCTI